MAQVIFINNQEINLSPFKMFSQRLYISYYISLYDFIFI